ncbi:MAG TPA: tetratricopeptide repeat protein [Thermoanaerobaculia bacterium]|jgi:Tfp pilus assembly protein PilF|nr:tetratricopeptide repeat protein [Thermoanaerobaculia bacterium]
MVRRRIGSLPKPLVALLSLALVAAFALAAMAAVPGSLGNLNRALESQKKLATERPQDPAVFNDLGNLYLLADQPAAAEEAYRKALALDPDKVTALFNLALLQQQHGERREALSLYKKVVALQPNHAWAHYQIGTLYESWDEDPKAIAEYARAFALDPQLAFKEVNPHIVENKLVTEAMIRAYDEEGASQNPQVPKAFDEPGRIAKLLVPTPQSAAETEAAAAQGQGTTQAQPGQPGQPGDTVLRPNDLRGGATNQAVPQGGSRTGRGSVRQQPMDRGLRQWERPDPNVAPQPMDPTAPRPGYPVQPGQVVTPPPGGVYYRPGSPSSGRLDIKVVPDGQRTARG